MATVTIRSDFGAPPKIKSLTVSTVSPSICYEVVGPDTMVLFFRILSFKPSFSVIKRLFGSSLSAIRVVSSVYLRLLIFLPAILIPACASSNPAFLMRYSACKLNKQGDNIKPWHTPFPIWNQTVVSCPILLLLDLRTDFSGGRSGGLVVPSLKEFSTVYCDLHSQRLWHSQESRNRCFSRTLLVFLMIQWMLAIWPLVPLPFLNPAWTSGS